MLSRTGTNIYEEMVYRTNILSSKHNALIPLPRNGTNIYEKIKNSENQTVKLKFQRAKEEAHWRLIVVGVTL